MLKLIKQKASKTRRERCVEYAQKIIKPVMALLVIIGCNYNLQGQRLTKVCTLLLMFFSLFTLTHAQKLPKDFKTKVLKEYNELVKGPHQGQPFTLKFKVYYQLRSKSYLSYQKYLLDIGIQKSSSNLCSNGTFESGKLNVSDWNFYWEGLAAGLSGTSAMNASNLQFNGNLTNCHSSHIGTNASQQVHHQVVSAGADPYFNQLNKAWSFPTGNTSSLRLGNDYAGTGKESIAKKVMITAANSQLSFSYALVMSNGHLPISQPHFKLSLIDASNPSINYDNLVNLGAGSNVLLSANPLLDTTGSKTQGTVYKDWDCVNVDLSSLIGKQIIILFETRDCRSTCHWAYAYIDNLCLSCNGAPSNSGSINLNEKTSDTCGIPNKICIDYTLPLKGKQIGKGKFRLDLIQNGNVVSTLLSPLLTSGTNYCFNLTTSNTSGLNILLGGFDFKVTGEFTLNSYPLGDKTIGSNKDGIYPGNNNDYLINCTSSPKDICKKLFLNAIKVKDPKECCYEIGVSNQYRNDHFSSILLETNKLEISSIRNYSNWGNIAYQNPHKVELNNPGGHINKGINILTMCFKGSGSDSLKIKWIGNAPHNDTLCTNTVPIIGCGNQQKVTCTGISNLKAQCDNGVVSMGFNLKNFSKFTMRGVTVYTVAPNDVTPVNQFIPIADLLPGKSVFIKVPLIVKNKAKKGCFYFAACDQNTTPGTSGQYPRFCCMDSIQYCVQIPACGIDSNGACNSEISIKPTSHSQKGDCCFDVTLTNRYNGGNIKYINFKGLGGTQFALFSGWSIIPPVSSSNIRIVAPGNGISPGVYPKFANFCLTGSSVKPHTVVAEYYDINGDFLCTDTMIFDNCKLVQPTCANIVNDSLYCEKGVKKFTFSVKNNSPFTIYHIDLRTTDSAVVISDSLVIPTPPIAPGKVGGPYTITIDSIGDSTNMFCMYLTAHNALYNPSKGQAATICCTDSLGVICLPMINCDSSNNPRACDTMCCAFGNITVPNGITPNGDGKNDLFIIKNSAKCKTIGITVYNRWGSKLYEDANYTNNWGGTNTAGQLLAQGTYYIVVQLATGERRAIYVDIRY